jgi:hypothetical protein
MVVYTSISQYLQTSSTLKERIDRIDSIILSMLGALEKAVTTGHFDEYSMDDGQVKIDTVYRDPNALTKTIEGLEKLNQMYRQRLVTNVTGRVTRLVDGRNFVYPN